jgi:hypothetical protein
MVSMIELVLAIEEVEGEDFSENVDDFNMQG